jgi:hypothetical protein
MVVLLASYIRTVLVEIFISPERCSPQKESALGSASQPLVVGTLFGSVLL